MFKKLMVIIGLFSLCVVAAPKQTVKTIVKADTTITTKIDTIRTVTYDTIKVTTILKDTSIVAKIDTVKTKSKPVIVK
jgi:hypothetical protein